MATLNQGVTSLLRNDLDEDNIEYNDYSESNEIIANSLARIVTPYYRDAEIYTYGSREIGVACDFSDLDIFIDTDDSFYTHRFQKNIKKRFNRTVQLLLHSNEWSDIYTVDAKIPLIQAYHEGEGVKCDISFSDGMGYCNTQLVKYFCELEPMMKPLIIILRIWLSRSRLSKAITKYTLTLLVISFLQHRRYLPSVKALQAGISEPNKIGPWVVDFDETNVEYMDLYSPDDLEELLSEFFKFFSSISKFDHVICTYLGTLAPVHYFVTPGVKSLRNYFRFVNVHRDESFIFSPMKVQGPFNLADNPAKQVSVKILNKFVNLCEASYDYMNS